MSMNRSVPEGNRILVVTLADLGDALLTIPALQALRQHLPHVGLDVLTTPVGAKVLRETRLVNDLIVFEKHRFNRPWSFLKPTNLVYALQLWGTLRRGQYDACVILRHLTSWFGTLKHAVLAAASGAQRRYGLDNGRGFFLTDRIIDQGFGAEHEAYYWLKVVGLLGAAQQEHQTPRTSLDVARSGADALQFLADVKTGPLIALHPGSGAFAPARRWYPARFAALADVLIDDGARLLLVGGPEEAQLRHEVRSMMRHADDVIDLGGQTTVIELAAILKQCTLFVGNDSGLSHLAASVGTPVVAIFGPTDPRAWGPYGRRSWQVEQHMREGIELLSSGPHRALKAGIACSPCIYRGHKLGTPYGCPDRTCLQRIDVAAPLAVIRQRLAELVVQPCASTT